MKTALLSDIHANVQALDACLAHAREQGADGFAVLGDLVGYGANPAEVVDRVMALAAAGAIVVQGNHDLMALTPVADLKEMGQLSADWTGKQLNAQHKRFLAELPLTARLEQCLLVHASADAPTAWRYVINERCAADSLEAACALDPGTRYVFGGHVHEQTLYYKGSGTGLMAFHPTPGVPIPTPAHRHWIATVGSVGQPRDGNPQAMYALFDHAAARLTFHRLTYDCAGAAAAIRRTGLPEYFAQRLEIGQ